MKQANDAFTDAEMALITGLKAKDRTQFVDEAEKGEKHSVVEAILALYHKLTSGSFRFFSTTRIDLGNGEELMIIHYKPPET